MPGKHRKNARRALLSALLVGVLLGASGCATKQVAPPRPPAKQAQKDPPRREAPAPLRHLAPPPAYGNKIVFLDEPAPEPRL